MADLEHIVPDAAVDVELVPPHVRQIHFLTGLEHCDVVAVLPDAEAASVEPAEGGRGVEGREFGDIVDKGGLQIRIGTDLGGQVIGDARNGIGIETDVHQYGHQFFGVCADAQAELVNGPLAADDVQFVRLSRPA